MNTPKNHIPLSAHFTASAVLIERNHILLVHHKKIGAWLPPGGHLDLDQGEEPHATALREITEETGLVCILANTAPTQPQDDVAYLMPAPLCVHRVVAFEKGQSVVHFDLAYMCKLDARFYPRLSDGLPPPTAALDEVHNSRWVALEEIETLPLARNVLEIVELARATYNLSTL